MCCFPDKETYEIDKHKKTKLNNTFVDAASKLEKVLNDYGLSDTPHKLSQFVAVGIMNNVRDIKDYTKNSKIIDHFYEVSTNNIKMQPYLENILRERIIHIVNIASRFRSNNATRKDYNDCLNAL